MGWGQRKHDPCNALASAVRRWLETRTTGDEEKVQEALKAYDDFRDPRKLTPPAGTYC